ncbi:transcription initiation factor TFIID subunit 4-like isoform X3 [Gadus chalcogrammus]|uniref:transcription initiation factor TFIID subunit 4-like isoform X3 n=1 Tax=Gadus chalcogrammus TaxID=1042646 RepID=UPI0024C478A7|nr:transcription initiation factor TFIID subunit 4-like isoform X3 [Gadus chalcogrammus]
MNAHTSGRAAPVTSDSTSNTSTMTAITSGSVLSKGNAIRTATSSNSVIQTHFTNSQNVAASTQPASQERGPMMTAMRTPMQGTGPSDTNMDVTLNGPNNTAGPTLVANAAGQIAPSAHTSVRAQTPLVNNGQLPAAAVSLGVGSHIIRAEPPKQIIQTLPQQGLPLGSVIGPRHVSPVALAPSPGGMRAPTQQLLAPRLPQTPAGQPNLQNFQLPPGMVLVRSESGQLLMIHQQALAQMQAQAAAAPRPATPTAMPLAQAPGIPMSSRPMGPGSMVRQASPVAPTTTLHRPPVLQSSGGPVPPGSATSTSPETTVAPPTSGPISNETMENVKKCRNFLSTLIKLASTGKQSAQTAENVKELVKELLRSLPALRQLTPNAALFAQQSHVPRPTASTPPPAKQPSSPATVVLRSPAPHLTTAVTRPQVQPDISRPGPVNQTLLQPQPLAVGMRPPVNMATAPMVTPRTQSPGKILVGPQQLRQLTSGRSTCLLCQRCVWSVCRCDADTSVFPVGPPGRTGLLPVFKSVPPAAASLAQKNHLKEAGGTFKDEDDINDVASMAGVNLTEESARILATNSELVGAVTHSCKDEAFLSTAVLQRRMLEIGKKFGVSELGVDVVTFVSHATQQSLQNLLEKVTQVAQHKNFSFKEESSYEGSSDVRAQLRFFEQLDQLEKQRKEGQERQILLKAAKSRARQEDPEQLRLKQKAKEMQQQELAMMRQKEANLTALAAIGPRKPRKPADASASAGAAEGSGSGSSLGAGSSGSRPTRQRITRINLKDLLFCLETERPTAHSQFLYKGFLK